VTPSQGDVAVELVGVEAGHHPPKRARNLSPSLRQAYEGMEFVVADQGHCFDFVVSDPDALLCPEFGEQRHCGSCGHTHKGNGAPQLSGWRVAVGGQLGL
jgi:hypothetical protein